MGTSGGKHKQAGIVVGLIGQPCSGKTTLRRALEDLGAEVVDADQIVRSLYADPAVRSEVAQLLGTEVIRPDGTIDRQAVADRVFTNRRLLERLTREIIWPRTGVRLRECIDEFRRRAGPGDVLILDAPTLVESGRQNWVDRIIWVEAPWERRVTWAAARGWSAEELRRREQAMLPEAHKKALADYVIVNDGSLTALRREATRLWNLLTDPP